MDIIASRQLLAFVICSSGCLIKVSKSQEEGLEVGRLGGEPRGWSGNQDLDVVLEALFRVIVIEGFDSWALFRAQLSRKAVKYGGLTGKGIRME